MPQQREPITRKPTVEDESTGNPPIRKGKGRPDDEGLPGDGGTKGGLNRYSGLRKGKDNDGKPKGK